MTERKYTDDHEWITMDGDVGTVGITDFAQEQLGDIVFIEVPDVGKELSKGDDVAVVEEFPIGGTGKILKNELREQFKDYKLPGT